MHPESSSDMKTQSFTRLSLLLVLDISKSQMRCLLCHCILTKNPKKTKNKTRSQTTTNNNQNKQKTTKTQTNKKPTTPPLQQFCLCETKKQTKIFHNISHEEKFLLLKFLLKRLFWFCSFCTSKDSVFKVHLNP